MMFRVDVDHSGTSLSPGGAVALLAFIPILILLFG